MIALAELFVWFVLALSPGAPPDLPGAENAHATATALHSEATATAVAREDRTRSEWEALRGPVCREFQSALRPHQGAERLGPPQSLSCSACFRGSRCSARGPPPLLPIV